MSDAAAPHQPLADRMRPRRLDDIVGQAHILGPEMPLRLAIEQSQLHSMVLWGPPGTGKTTLARIVAAHADAEFESVSAVLSGVKDIRAAVDRAKQNREQFKRQTILFVDEVHRFNKSQQDAFLPHIENGTIVFIGATTENPAFELNNALLSRLRVYVLRSLDAEAIATLIHRALHLDDSDGRLLDSGIKALAAAADGDGRRALNLLEILLAADPSGGIDEQGVKGFLSGSELRRFDKGGDAFYDQISALHKSVRGSNPDAALYWFARMLDGGIDPLYIARRAVRIASEDIGNADPRALNIALDAWETFLRLGSPEGELAIAQALVYCAVAPKSNAVYRAFNAAKTLVASGGSSSVPAHLRNAPTKLAESQGHGRDYRYDHDEDGGFSAGQRYFPDELGEQQFYQPVNRGMEIKIAEKLKQLRQQSGEQ